MNDEIIKKFELRKAELELELIKEKRSSSGAIDSLSGINRALKMAGIKSKEDCIELEIADVNQLIAKRLSLIASRQDKNEASLVEISSDLVREELNQEPKILKGSPDSLDAWILWYIEQEGLNPVALMPYGFQSKLIKLVSEKSGYERRSVVDSWDRLCLRSVHGNK